MPIRARRPMLAIACAALALAAAPRPADAQDANLELFKSGLSQPLHMVTPPGEPNRQFIVQRGGVIRVVENGVLLPTPFLTITGVQTQNLEQGLLGLAFPPDYTITRRFYVNYVVPRGVLDPNGVDRGRTVVARYTTSANPNIANTTGETLFTEDQPFANHNGGTLQFGPDGLLYIGMGDGGSGNDPGNRAQSLTTRLGKMLRIDASAATGYTIPPSNPYAGSPTTPNEIYMLGLRNPWKFSFDRLTGALYIADVGQDMQEEVNYFPPGAGNNANLGWRCMEGTFCTGLSGCTCNSPALWMPVHTYAHPTPQASRSVTGGYVYRGNAIPRWRGRYFFADFVTNELWSFKLCGGIATDLVEHGADLRSGGTITTFGGVAGIAEDAAGELYIVELFGNRVLKIVPQFPPADWDRNGSVGTSDISSFLSNWFADLTNATRVSDINGDCIVGTSDVTGFLTLWFGSF
ncbi:MAG TPA: PQQ-dependent sugar dehydrogenase [Phycisphaerales bacterium]|nr:PQQ-dependent sugar dehydrogenase [Phycisphaerales bacterium]